MMHDTTATIYPGQASSAHGEMHQSTRIHPVKLGTLLFLASEAVFFAVLIISYVYYKAQVDINSNGPSAKSALDVGRTGIYTFLLLASSGTIVLAERGFKHGKDAAGKIWLAFTILLGAIFLGGQAIEYVGLYSENITINRNLFGTTFFTVTGFHGAHVFGGLIMLIILLVLSLQGSFKRGKHIVALEAVSYYWHFVDIVWVFVFSVVYLWTLIS